MPRQRLYLSDCAAEQPFRDRLVEDVRALPRDHALQMHRVRGEQLEVEPRIAVAQALYEVERLLRHPPGVDAEDADLRIDLVRHVEDGDAVDLERGRDGDARREALDRPLEDDVGLLALELDGELAGLQLVDQLDRHYAASASTSASPPRSRFRAGSSPASAPSSSSESLVAKAANDSAGLRPSSQPSTRPA